MQIQIHERAIDPNGLDPFGKVPIVSGWSWKHPHVPKVAEVQAVLQTLAA